MGRIAFVIYRTLFLTAPVLTVVAFVLFFGAAATQATKFRLDASADSLVLENDQSLKYYRGIAARYGSEEFLVITYSPNKDLFSDEVLAEIGRLRDELETIESVNNVLSILDVPLVESPPVTLDQLEKEIPTISSGNVDIQMAKQELLTSPIYHQLIISDDARTTAIQVNFKRDPTYSTLLDAREALRAKELEGPLSPEDQIALKSAEDAFAQYSAASQEQQAADIERVRQIMEGYKSEATLHLGGVPMIAADSVAYVRNDLVTFGIGVVVFLIVLLTIAFQKPRWVILPMMTCVAAGVTMTGLMGFLDWPVTVVSSNFISLMLIITLSLCVHLIVRYNEFHRDHPDATEQWLVIETLRAKVGPCFYTAATTIVAFGSLIVSGIQPVAEFGRMMAIGTTMAFVFAFTFFPAALLLLKAGTPTHKRELAGAFTLSLARTIHFIGQPITLAFAALFAVSIYGMSLLSVENRFIDYYKPSTEIYQGMEVIDRELGGTTPLDVVLDAPASFFEDDAVEGDTDGGDDPLDEFGFDDDWLSEEDDSAGITASSYWFNKDKLDEVAAIHDYLDDLQITGKTLSIINGLRVLEEVSPETVSDNFNLAILYKRLPEELKKQLVDPYMSEDGNQIRFSIRVFETDSSLKRDELLKKIHHDLTTEFGLEEDQVHLTGMLVLYNNMLQSLFKSQILTLGFVFVVILGMFIISFRSIKLSLLAIIPNIGSAFVILGLMGWRGIPLDIMTITIAAITVGIAVDNSIHFVHRFKEEFAEDGLYWESIFRSHGTIGRAMYYTTIVVALGFSILTLSNFVPTVYFGLLTSLSMVVALVANLTLLPLLIVLFKPLGREHEYQAA